MMIVIKAYGNDPGRGNAKITQRITYYNFQFNILALSTIMLLRNNYRHVIAALLLGSTLVTYIGRLNMSTAIVSMVRKQAQGGEIINSSNSDVCPDVHQVSHTHDSDDGGGEFAWDQTTQGLVLGSFFWSYGPGQVISGRLGDMFGARWLCFVAILGTGILNLLIPVMARANLYALLANRVVMGALQTSLFPASFVISSKWTPDQERSVVLAFNIVGGIIGSIIAAAMTGFIAKNASLGGWATVFYVSGVINILFAIVWVWLLTDRPEDHRWVTESENKYICENIQTLSGDSRRRPARSMPWTKVYTNPIVYAVYLTRFTMICIFSLFTLKLPTYMQQVLRLPIDTISYYTAILGGIQVLSNLAGGILADRLIRSGLLQRTTVRKLLESIAVFGTIIQMCLISLTSCDSVHFLLLMAGAMTTFGFQAGGEAPIVSDLTSRFSGTVFGIGNALAMSSSFVVPMAVGAVLDADVHRPKHAWQIIFYTLSGFAVLGGISFLLFAKAEPQDWDWEEQHDDEERKEDGVVVKPLGESVNHFKTYGVYQPSKH